MSLFKKLSGLLSKFLNGEDELENNTNDLSFNNNNNKFIEEEHYMPENPKGIRLAKAAAEFNVGRNSIVEHLTKKGFQIQDTPNTPLTQEMYDIIVRDFKQDKQDKEVADKTFARHHADKPFLEEEKPLTPSINTPLVPPPPSTFVDNPPAPLLLNTEAKIKPEPKLEPKIELEPKPEPKLEPKIELEPKPELKLEPQIELEPKPELKLEPKIELEPKPELKLEPKIELEPKPETEIISQLPEYIKINSPEIKQPIVKKTIDLENHKRPKTTEPAPEPKKQTNNTPTPQNNTIAEKKQRDNNTQKNNNERKRKPTSPPPPNANNTQAPPRNTPITTPPPPPINTPPPTNVPIPELEKIETKFEQLPGLNIKGTLELASIRTEKPAAPTAEDKKKQKRKRIRKEKKVDVQQIGSQVTTNQRPPRNNQTNTTTNPNPHQNNNRNQQPQSGNQNNNNNRNQQPQSGNQNNNNNRNQQPQSGNQNNNNRNQQPQSGNQNNNNNRNQQPQSGNQNNNNNRNQQPQSGNQNNNNNRNQQPQSGNQNNNNNRRNTSTNTYPNHNRPNNTNNQPAANQTPPVISEKQIQDQIRSTMAKIAGTNNPANKARATGKAAKEKKIRTREQEAANFKAERSTILQVTEFIPLSEFAKIMNVPINEIITLCFNLGRMVTINYRLEADLIEIVAEEFGYEVEFINVAEQDEEEAPDPPETLQPRAPIVTIMGHVDHGKTSLLDYIRSSNVIAGEAGGITQHIAAYEVTLPDQRQITFLDTPGHQAFTAMRARGAKVTDIAVIVIAADDGIMTQTKEAISHAQAANAPMIFAINKVDKPGANPEKVREQLSSMNILAEEWGGKYQTQEVSAKKGINVEKLLDKILIEAEFLELKANPNRLATGTVIEATLDKGKGYVATIMVQNGTLKVGDPLVAGGNYGKIKAMFNERGKRITTAKPSTPVWILGLNGAPQAGDKFKVMPTEQEAREIANKREQILRQQQQRAHKHITLEEIGRRLALGNFKELNLIVKGDVDGSVEALADSLLRLSNEEVQIKIIYRAVGPISEADVLLAKASDAIIIGFQVRPLPNARRQAEQDKIDIRLYSIIYDAINEIKDAILGMLEPEKEEKFVCNIEIREVFKISKIGTVAGCYVTDGKVQRDTKVRVVRNGIVVFTGELSSLKRFKEDVKEVPQHMECGLTIKNFSDIKEGDQIEGYEIIEKKRTL